MGYPSKPATGTVYAKSAGGIWVPYAVGGASGLATLDSGGKVPLAQLPAGVAGGVATLDGSALVPTTQLRGSGMSLPISTLVDSHTLSAWYFDEAAAGAGATVHNYGSVGDSSATQLTTVGNAVLGAPGIFRTGMGCAAANNAGGSVGGGGAVGAPTIEPTGTVLTIDIVFVPFSVAAFTALFGKSFQAPPNGWSDPFKALDIAILPQGLITGSVARGNAGFGANALNSVIIGQPNYAKVTWDPATSIITVGLNGEASQSNNTGTGGDLNYVHHGYWYVGRNPAGSDPFDGIVFFCGIHTVARSDAFGLSIFKTLSATTW